MEAELLRVLENLIIRYITLSNLVNSSTSSVRWDPETDVEIVDARRVIERCRLKGVIHE